MVLRKVFFMALPIKETPILKGKDAKRFIERLKEAETSRVPKADYERAQKIYTLMKLNKETCL
jgi:hypothetical protein